MSSIKLESNASGTGVFTIASPNSNTNRTLSIPDGTGSIVVNGVNSSLVSGTAVASTSGTSIDFTGIPSWVKRITVMFNGVSTNGTSNPLIQLGDSGGVETTGYAVSSLESTTTHYTTGFGIKFASAAAALNGSLTLSKLDGNVWIGTGAFNNTGVAVAHLAGSKTLSDTLTQVRMTTVNGTDTFDAGTINILYE
jgi:hypothetical protein